MNNSLLGLELNLLAEVIGIAITVFLIDRIIRKREKRRIAPVKDALLDRIETHGRLLTAWVQIIAYEKKEVSGTLTDRIKVSKIEMLESLSLGDEIISPNIQEAVLSLDKKIEILLNAISMREVYPDELWVKDIYETLSQLKTIFDLLGSKSQSISVESWLEVFREVPYTRVKPTKAKKTKRKKKPRNTHSSNGKP